MTVEVVFGSNEEKFAETGEHFSVVYRCLQSLVMYLEFKLIDDIKFYGLMTKRNKTANTISSKWVLDMKKH